MRTLVVGTALWLWFCGGCTQEQRYVYDNEVVALTADTAPAVMGEDDDDSVFIVERRFELPITPLSDATREMLRERGRAADLPFRRAPWVENQHLAVEVDWVLANLDEDPIQVLLTLNGINEFHEYAPTQDDFNQWERRLQLDGEERVTGTITQEEMEEVAVDLATVPSAPNSNQVVYFESHSRFDERVQGFIPAIIPGLVGFRSGMVTQQAGNVVLELSVRVTDHGLRLADAGNEPWNLPNPELFLPVVPMEE